MTMQPIIFTAHVTPNTDNVRTISSCSAAGLGLQTWLQKTPQKKIHTCVCEQSAERWSSTLRSSPQIQETCVCKYQSGTQGGVVAAYGDRDGWENEKVLSEDGATSRAEK